MKSLRIGALVAAAAVVFAACGGAASPSPSSVPATEPPVGTTPAPTEGN